MKRVVRIVVIVIILLIAVAFLGYTQIARVVSHVLTDKAGVEVSIDRIQLTTNNIGIYNVDIENFPDSVLQTALQVKSTDIAAPLREYTKEEIVIEQITLRDLYIGLEFPGTSYSNSNWERIGKNLSSSNSSDAKEESKEVLIKVLELHNIQVEIAMDGKHDKVKRMAPIKNLRFTNVTSSGGIPSAQIMNLIIQQALKDFLSPKNLENMIRQGLNPDSGALKGLFSEAD